MNTLFLQQLEIHLKELILGIIIVNFIKKVYHGGLIITRVILMNIHGKLLLKLILRVI